MPDRAARARARNLDAALARRLAIEKLDAKAAELRSQWAWTKAVLEPEYGFLAPYGRIEPQPAETPPELAEEIERIEQRAAELEELSEADWTAEFAAEADRLEERRDEIDAIIDRLAVYTEADRARAGCIVTIGEDGAFQLYEGLVERTARRSGADSGVSEMPTRRTGRSRRTSTA